MGCSPWGRKESDATERLTQPPPPTSAFPYEDVYVSVFLSQFIPPCPFPAASPNLSLPVLPLLRPQSVLGNLLCDAGSSSPVTA